MNIGESSCITVFAKSWKAKSVKTRLASSLGERKAKSIYLSMLDCVGDRLSERFANLVWAVDDVRFIEDFQERFGNKWNTVAQSDGDLTARLCRYFKGALADYQKVIVIGSDHPDIPLEHLSTAIEQLDNVDVVLGPTEDGGYCLVGMTRTIDQLFDGIQWSTERVLEQSIANLEKAGCSYYLLPRWFDVDHHEDLIEMLNRISRTTLDTPLVNLKSAIMTILESDESEN